ncbi:TetR/AcrR family transcriptional regulator [Halioglobus maricola]|uniref:TetR/AcrR family transcriptional regulator n=1 Tax=Halioglobus maricola TaxID=2601894 RepID=A0A5P9NLA5_9GAMM|nr:TetR/AcrR family transcriptional regulator [Halioglobus maricola]QFU75718.1 TetR/AcrR family transcriptional regulator [Halioglobus maricola]
MTDTTQKRKTQAQRRAESSQAVLRSAARLFGERGYADTSLDDIAADCGLTIRPIYHYFGNKKALFGAVNELMEQRIIAALGAGEESEPGERLLVNWRAYLDLCDDPAFRRIVLIDSPNILGRERWVSSPVSSKARKILDEAGGSNLRSSLINRVLTGALTEAALAVAEADDIDAAKIEAEALISKLYSALVSV